MAAPSLSGIPAHATPWLFPAEHVAGMTKTIVKSQAGAITPNESPAAAAPEAAVAEPAQASAPDKNSWWGGHQ